MQAECNIPAAIDLIWKGIFVSNHQRPSIHNIQMQMKKKSLEKKYPDAFQFFD